MLAEITAQPFLVSCLMAALALIGAGAGILAGLFGIGGGIILVPTISTALHLLGTPSDDAMRVAIATSLATILPSSISSLRAHNKRGGIDWSLLKYWSPLIMIGALAGSFLGRYVSGFILRLTFGCILLFTASRFLKPLTQQDSPQDINAPHRVGRTVQQTFAFLIGCSSAMIGAGGGIFGVPAMTYVGLPLKRAIGTASTFGVMVAIPGVTNYLLAHAPNGIPLGGTWGLVHPAALLLLIPGAVLGAPFGAKLAHKLPVAQLRRGFGVLVALLGLRMLYTGFFG